MCQSKNVILESLSNSFYIGIQKICGIFVHCTARFLLVHLDRKLIEFKNNFINEKNEKHQNLFKYL